MKQKKQDEIASEYKEIKKYELLMLLFGLGFTIICLLMILYLLSLGREITILDLVIPLILGGTAILGIVYGRILTIARKAKILDSLIESPKS